MNKKWTRVISVAAAVVVTTAALAAAVFHIERNIPVNTAGSSARTIVIDPGHGGEDGGAVGYSGSVEKGINLSISQKLHDLLTLCGFRVIMTREDDRSIHDEDANTISEQKRSDLYNRLEIYNEDPGAIVLSIHLNKYEDSSVHGAQIFYSQNQNASKQLAQSIQSAFVMMLQPENTREIKPAESNLFLMFHAEVPAVLCECGFLSNPDEEALLQDEEYQSKVAFTIFTGLMDYLLA